jgi:hypothetical protein
MLGAPLATGAEGPFSSAVGEQRCRRIESTYPIRSSQRNRISPRVMTGFTANVFPYRNRVSFKEAFAGPELCDWKLSRTVLRGLDGRKVVWLLGKLSSPVLRGLSGRKAARLPGDARFLERSRFGTVFRGRSINPFERRRWRLRRMRASGWTRSNHVGTGTDLSAFADATRTQRAAALVRWQFAVK